MMARPKFDPPNSPVGKSTLVSIRNDIVSRMEKLGMSCYKLSQVSGVNYDTTRRFIAGTHDTSTKNASRLIAGLDICEEQQREFSAEDSTVTS